MNKRILAFLTFIPLVLTACDRKFEYQVTSDFTYEDSNVNIVDNIATVEGKKAHVVLLFGQSNADGVSYNECLERTFPEVYTQYASGFDDVLINFYNDGGNNSSGYAFTKCALGCGCSPVTFGPEMGIAESLHYAYQGKDTQSFIIKWTWGGTTLHDQWLNGKHERGDLYNSAMDFALKCLRLIKSKGYSVSEYDVCWMQGENDACKFSNWETYYTDTVAFVSLLRHDLASYSDRIAFIDAEINEEGMWPHAKAINKAKRKFGGESTLNSSVETNDMKLTSLHEPEENPDIAHYDSLSMVALGRKFGERTLSVK